MCSLVDISKADVLPEVSGAAALLNGHYAPPPNDEDGKVWARTSVIVQAHPRTLYEMWHDLEAIPAWQERMVEVRRTGETTSHWVMRDEPGDKVFEWDSEILADEPEKRIAWRSIGGDIENAGEVIFEPAPGNRGTLVTVLQQFRMGKLTRAWEAITGRDPKQSVIENLRHFKAMAETGEIPRTEPQPHGDRGTIGGLKRSIYGETIATPPATAPSETAEKG
jgi:uncharacterized membrane protein